MTSKIKELTLFIFHVLYYIQISIDKGAVARRRPKRGRVESKSAPMLQSSGVVLLILRQGIRKCISVAFWIAYQSFTADCDGSFSKGTSDLESSFLCLVTITDLTLLVPTASSLFSGQPDIKRSTAVMILFDCNVIVSRRRLFSLSLRNRVRARMRRRFCTRLPGNMQLETFEVVVCVVLYGWINYCRCCWHVFSMSFSKCDDRLKGKSRRRVFADAYTALSPSLTLFLLLSDYFLDNLT